MKFKIDDKVKHNKYGEGVVIKVDSSYPPYLVKCEKSTLWCSQFDLEKVDER